MYLLFAGFDRRRDPHLPSGGAKDCIGVYNTLNEAMRAQQPRCDWKHIAKSFDGELIIVAEWSDEEGDWIDPE